MPEGPLALQVRFSPRRLGHANLFCGELERSMDFYNRICGIEEVRREPGIVAGFLSTGHTHHDIGLIQVTEEAEERVGWDGHVQIPRGRGRHAGLNHLGWEMEHEAALVAAYHRLGEAGMKAHRTTDHQIAHSIYLFDPDGNLNEFYADAMKDWRTVFNPSQTDLVSGNWDPDGAPPSVARNYAMVPDIRRVPSAIFHPARISHVVYVARNFERMCRFYAEIAGLSVIQEGRDQSFMVFKGPAAVTYDMVIFAPRQGVEPGLHHFALEVVDEVEYDRSLGQVAQASLPIERTVETSRKRGAFLRDPDGIRVEVFHRRSVDRYRPVEETADPSLQPFLA